MSDLPDLRWKNARAKALRFAVRECKLGAAPELQAIIERLIIDEAEDIPRWPSGLHSDFDAVLGGFTGMTVIGGAGGSGKSMAALACGLENALEPETVVFYLDAENALGEQRKRAVRWFGSAALFMEQMKPIAGVHFHWVEVMPGMRWDHLMFWCSERILMEHGRVIFILDSVNSIARMQGGKEWERSSDIYMACNALVRATKGAVGVLALSELNASADLRGREAVHHATLALKLEPDPDLEALVRLKMLKHRTGQFRSDLGLYEIRHLHTRLSRYAEQERHHADA